MCRMFAFLLELEYTPNDSFIWILINSSGMLNLTQLLSSDVFSIVPCKITKQ